MLYAMQVFGGIEYKTLLLCKAAVSDNLMKECFSLRYQRMHGTGAKAKLITRELFTGYLFIEAEESSIEQIKLCLLKVPELTKLLRSGIEMLPLTTEEALFIRIHGGADHILKMSKGYQIGKYVRIEEGAFAGFYGELEKVDRHKKYGQMKINMFGGPRTIEFGLEIIKKIPYLEKDILEENIHEEETNREDASASSHALVSSHVLAYEDSDNSFKIESLSSSSSVPITTGDYVRIESGSFAGFFGEVISTLGASDDEASATAELKCSISQTEVILNIPINNLRRI